MLNWIWRKFKSFSLLELMAVIAIIAILAVIAIPAYRDYIIRASIAALVPTADKVKNEVEDAHNQGTIFGTSGDQTYIASGATDKPYAMLDLVRSSYGCVDIGIDLATLALDDEQELTLTWCPAVDNGSIEWQCGYVSGSYAAYVQYLPKECQQVNTSIQDTSF